MFACPACCPRSSVPLSAHRCFFLFLCLFEWMYFTFSTFCAIFAVWPSYIFTLSLSMAGNSNFLKCQCIVSGVGVHFLNPAMVNNIRLFEINHHFCLTKWSKCFEPCHYFLKFSYLSPFWMWYLLCPQSKSQVFLWDKSSKGLPRAFWDAVFWNAKVLSCSPQIDQIMVVKRVRNDKVGAPPRGKLAADC